MQKKASMFQKFMGLFVFLLPWQMVYIYQEFFLDGVKLQWITRDFFATELLLFVCIGMFMYSYIGSVKENISRIVFKFSKERFFFLSILLFILYAFLSVFWSKDPQINIQNTLRIIEGFLLFIMLVFSSLDKKKLAVWFVVGATVASVLGIGQFIFQDTFSSKILGLSVHHAYETGVSVVSTEHFGRWIRAYGPFAHPNVFGGYLVISLIITFFLFSTPSWKNKKNIQFFLFFASILQLTALFFTLSRSAVLSLILFFLGWTLLNKKITHGIFYGLLFLLTLSLFFLPLIQVRLFGGSSYEVNSIRYRTSGYAEAFQIIRKDPLFGVGVGNYTYALLEQDAQRSAYSLEPVHNVPLLFVAELGFLGVLFFFMVLWSGMQLIWKELLPFGKAFLILLLFSFSPLWIFDHYLYSSYVGIIFLALLFVLFSCLPTYYSQVVGGPTKKF